MEEEEKREGGDEGRGVGEVEVRTIVENEGGGKWHDRKSRRRGADAVMNGEEGRTRMEEERVRGRKDKYAEQGRKEVWIEGRRQGWMEGQNRQK